MAKKQLGQGAGRFSPNSQFGGLLDNVSDKKSAPPSNKHLPGQTSFVKGMDVPPEVDVKSIEVIPDEEIQAVPAHASNRVKRSYKQMNYQRISDDGEIELRQYSFLIRDDIKTKLTEMAFNSKPKKSVALLINEILAEKLAEKN